MDAYGVIEQVPRPHTHHEGYNQMGHPSVTNIPLKYTNWRQEPEHVMF